MKKIAFFFCFLMIGLVGFAQTDKTANTEVKFPEYIENGKIPTFSIFAAPDSTVFTNKDLDKNKPLLVMIFSPECGHCQHETQLIEQNMEHFKNAQILMVTWFPFGSLNAFSQKYGTTEYPNIILAQDPHDFFYDYYDVHKYPKLIVYNKNGDYVSNFDGNIVLEDVWSDLAGE